MSTMKLRGVNHATLYGPDRVVYRHLEADMAKVEGVTVTDEIAGWAKTCHDLGWRITAVSGTRLMFYPPDKSIDPVPCMSRLSGRSLVNTLTALVRAGMPDPRTEHKKDEPVTDKKPAPPTKVKVIVPNFDEVLNIAGGIDDIVPVAIRDALCVLLDPDEDSAMKVRALFNAVNILTLVGSAVLKIENDAVTPAATRLAELEVKVVDLERDLDAALGLVQKEENAKVAMRTQRDDARAQAEAAKVEAQQIKSTLQTLKTAFRGLGE
jgi:hypothetical protein